MDSILRDIIEHTPKTGYNICGLDCYELPGESLYFMKHFDTWEDAVRELDGWESKGANVVIFPNGKRRED